MFSGHSLGAQFIGYLAQHIKSSSGKQVNAIIGLDPAGPVIIKNIANLFNFICYNTNHFFKINNRASDQV